ncbi:alpha/beta hydrolase domain-containing protein [Ramlibacter solisilvae]
MVVVTPATYKVNITKTEDVPGTFGSVGAYQRLTGTFTGEVDPKDAKNAIIQDLSLAPLNANGKVEYTAEFVLAMPKDMSKANGVLRYDAPNRGGTVAMDSYFASRGYVFLTSAWQGDVPAAAGKLTLTVPVAKNADGTSITGTYRAELFPATNTTNSLTLPGGQFNGAMVPYAPASLDNTLAGYTLTRRINESDARELIPASDWKFAKCDATTAFPGTPDGANICVKGGFDSRYMYEIVYVAKDPKVMGLGFAAVRDMVAFFHNKDKDAAGNANPVFGKITKTIASGVSQCGNFIKTFVHLGFNQDIDNKQVFDGVFAQIAARQTNLNTRFAVPGGGGGVRGDFTALGQAGTRGLAADYVDEVSQRSDGGILKRCTATSTCPKLFIGFSGSEFWALQGSPLLTTAFGTSDLVQPANARIYYYSSSHHVLGLPSVPANTNTPPFAVGNLYATNGNTGVVSVVRALYQDLEEWVVAGTTPPDSQVPKIADATLVRPAAVAFPSIPGVTFTGLHTRYPLLDWGPNFKAKDETGIVSQLPPAYLGRDYAILVPQVDIDGNDKAGIRSIDVAAGLGTNTGWNYTNKPGVTDLAGSPLAPGLVGAYFPYPKTRADRLASGDPRLSLEERYVNQAGYVAAVTAAANDLVARRFMLRVDADAAIASAVAKPILP